MGQALLALLRDHPRYSEVVSLDRRATNSRHLKPRPLQVDMATLA